MPTAVTPSAVLDAELPCGYMQYACVQDAEPPRAADRRPASAGALPRAALSGPSHAGPASQAAPSPKRVAPPKKVAHQNSASGQHSVLSSYLLYCTVMYCTVLYCTVLYCTVLLCTLYDCFWSNHVLLAGNTVCLHAYFCLPLLATLP